MRGLRAPPAYARTMGALPEAAIALFRTLPDRFVADRDALVKELRADGRDDDAAAVKALRKPTATVWALNQLADRQPDALAALFEAGRALRAAQSEAIAGSSSAALVEAGAGPRAPRIAGGATDRKSTPLESSEPAISYAGVFFEKKKKAPTQKRT